MPFVDTGRLRTFHEIEGDGPPVVLVSGLGASRLPWRASVVPALVGAGHRVVTFDHRDAGRTGESPTRAYTVRDLADDVLALMCALDLPPVHLVGHSLGGMVAQDIAMRHDDRLASLTLLGSAGRCDAYEAALLEVVRSAKAHLPERDFRLLMATGTLARNAFEHAPTLSRFRDLVASEPCAQGAAALSRQIDAMLAHDLLDELGDLDVPTHVVCGSEDRLLPPRHSRALQEAIPGSALTVLEGLGHDLVTEGGERTARATLGFWRGLPLAEPSPGADEAGISGGRRRIA